MYFFGLGFLRGENGREQEGSRSEKTKSAYQPLGRLRLLSDLVQHGAQALLGRLAVSVQVAGLSFEFPVLFWVNLGD